MARRRAGRGGDGPSAITAPRGDRAIVEALERWVDDARSAMTDPDPGGPRAALLGAARAEFATNGFRATTTRAIARSAGVNLALVHYYFRNKEQLYRRVLAGELTGLLSAVAGGFASVDLTPGEMLVQLPGRIVDAATAVPHRVDLIRRELGDGAGRLRSIIVELGPRGPLGFREIGVSLVKSAQKRGDMIREDPEAILALLLSQAYGLLFAGPAFRLVFGRDAGDRTFMERTLRAGRELTRRALGVPGDDKE